MQNIKKFILIFLITLVLLGAFIFFNKYLKSIKKPPSHPPITPIFPTSTPIYQKMLDNKILEKVVVEPKNGVIWVKKDSVEQGDKVYMPFDGKLIIERRNCYKDAKGKNICDLFVAAVDEKNKIRIDFNGRMESRFKDGEYFVKKGEVIATFDKENLYHNNIAVFQVTKNYQPDPQLVKELFK